MTRALLILTATALCAPAQWLNEKTPNIPRTADGKPDLSAPTPRLNGKPDFSGLWHGDPSGSGPTQRAMAAISAQPWAEALSKKRLAEQGKEDTFVLCLPFGARAGIAPEKILQTPTMIVFLYDDLSYRQVFLDGRALPQDPNPAWMGYSVGHWDGDTLIVESTGYNDRSWLDDLGHPHSESLHVTERFERPDFGHLSIVVTYDDPKALAQPWTIPLKREYHADSELLEYVCAENERDRTHLVGKSGDEKEVDVAPEILARYPGTYLLKPPNRPDVTVAIHISLTGKRLMLDLDDGPPMPMLAISETKFFMEMMGGHVEFPRDGTGLAPYLTVSEVEGDLKATRKP